MNNLRYTRTNPLDVRPRPALNINRTTSSSGVSSRSGLQTAGNTQPNISINRNTSIRSGSRSARTSDECVDVEGLKAALQVDDLFRRELKSYVFDNAQMYAMLLEVERRRCELVKQLNDCKSQVNIRTGGGLQIGQSDGLGEDEAYNELQDAYAELEAYADLADAQVPMECPPPAELEVAYAELEAAYADLADAQVPMECPPPAELEVAYAELEAAYADLAGAQVPMECPPPPELTCPPPPEREVCEAVASDVVAEGGDSKFPWWVVVVGGISTVSAGAGMYYYMKGKA